MKQINIYDFKQFEAIRSFDNNICTGQISIDEAEMDQSNLIENKVGFNNKTRPKKEDKRKKNFFDSISALYEGRELTLNAFRSGYF